MAFRPHPALLMRIGRIGMARRGEANNRLDDAARAGWLYYVAGRTQDEIATVMGISRQSAQRLVSLAMSERLIKVRLDHPIAACLEAAAGLRDRYGLKHVEVVPSDPGSTSTIVGVRRSTRCTVATSRSASSPKNCARAVGRSGARVPSIRETTG